MKFKAVIIGLAIVTAASAAFALPGNRHLVYTDEDFGFCYKVAYYHMKDASMMIVRSANHEENNQRHLRILHRDGDGKWLNSDVRCEMFPPIQDIPPRQRFKGLEVNGKLASFSETIEAREKAHL